MTRSLSYLLRNGALCITITAMNKKTAELIATLCYAGYAPIASGTVGTMLAMALYYVVVKDNAILCAAAATITLALGFVASGVHEKYAGKKDPHEIIIDEAAGVFIMYLFIPFSLKLFIIGFFIYRLLDILKPPPLRQLERLPGGAGIMLDDIGAAVYTNIILHGIRHFIA